MSDKFKTAEFSQRALELFNKTAAAMQASQNETVRGLADKVPESFADSGRPLSIVFAGQYSAGKSSILSLLTGIRQKSGQGITTAEISRLDWNGIEVIDTPGIHTELHGDHDRITYEAISAADLIVFVLTNEGFSNHLAGHFRKLVNEMGKGHEMMLVVNKMDNEAEGNTPGAREIKKEHLDRVLAPSFTADDMYVSFISSELYRESLQNDDPELGRELLEESGWESLIANLNRFAADRRLAARYTTNLYRLEQLLYDAIAMYRTADPEADATVELLNRNRRALTESRRKIRERVNQEIRQGNTRVAGLGDSIALALNSGVRQEEFNGQLNDAFEQTDMISDYVLEQIERIISEESEQLGKAMAVVMDSQLAADLKARFQEEITRRNINPEYIDKLGKGAKYASEVSTWITNIMNTPGVKTGWKQFFKINGSGASQASKAVIEIGNFFGHQIKPWKAAKIANRVGTAGKVIGVAGVVAGVALQIWNDRQDKEKEQYLLETRTDIRNSFREAAAVMDEELTRQSDSWMEKEIDTMIAEIDGAIAEFERSRAAGSRELEELTALLGQTQTLIAEMQKEST